MARLAYVDPASLPAEKRDLLDTMADDVGDGGHPHSLEGGTLNVYRLLGRRLPLLAGFREYLSVVWAAGGRSADERELVILATARQVESRYVWQQHVRVALDEGMAVDRILAVAQDPQRLDDRAAALVTYVRRFVEGRVDDETHDRLAAHVEPDAIVGIGMLAGCYLGLARVLQALEVDLEAPFVGWDLAQL
jgi:alkylhydroperoxidase family enzyme